MSTPSHTGLYKKWPHVRRHIYTHLAMYNGNCGLLQWYKKTCATRAAYIQAQTKCAIIGNTDYKNKNKLKIYKRYSCSLCFQLLHTSGLY